MQSGFSPIENLIFYGTETLTGWQLIFQKVGEEVPSLCKSSFCDTYFTKKYCYGFVSGDYVVI